MQPGVHLTRLTPVAFLERSAAAFPERTAVIDGERRLELNDRDRAEKAGTRRGAARPSRIPFAEVRLHDPEGNGVDISVKGWDV